MKTVIIGGGTAGLAAATRLRRMDENAEIVIYEKTAELGVVNCILPYYLSGRIKLKSDLIGIDAPALKAKYNIEAHLDSEVTSLDRKAGKITVNNQYEVAYDKLILALGAQQLRPDIEGILGEGIFTIKTLESVLKIKEFIRYNDAKKALILGGGDTGIETAEALRQIGMEVTVVEASSHVLPYLDPEMAALVNNELRHQGIKLFLNRKIAKFGEFKAWLDDGSEHEFDIAIIATGVKPDLLLPITANLKVGDSGGIIVNEYMQTNDKNIYAIGDNIEQTNFITGRPQRMAHAGLAIKEARIAADHITGKKSRLPAPIGTAVTQVFNLTSGAVGCHEKCLKEAKIDYRKVYAWAWSNSQVFENAALMLFKLLFSKEGRLFGIQGIGAHGIDKRLDVVSAFISTGSRVENLTTAEICYAPPFAEAKDIINILGSAAEGILSGTEKIMEISEMEQLQKEGKVMIIDVRPLESFKTDHIAGAVNIPFGALRHNLDSIPHDKKVVLYCNRGYAANNGAHLLANRGFDNIYILGGSFNLYQALKEDREALSDNRS